MTTTETSFSDIEAVTMAANMNADTVREQQKEIARLEGIIGRVRAQLDTPMNHRLIVECIDGIVNPRGSHD